MIAFWLRRLLGLPGGSRNRWADPRQETRKAISHPITVHVDGRSIVCDTINLSASGALINVALTTSVGAAVQVESPQLPRLIAARVSRIGAHSTAVEFQSIELGASLVASISAENARMHARPRSQPQRRAASGSRRQR